MRSRELAAAIVLPALLAVGVFAAAAPQTAISKIDALYFHRDQGHNLDLSLDQIKAALSKTPNDPALLWREGRSLIRLAEKETLTEKQVEILKQARKDLEASLKMNASQPDAHYWLGVALGRIGQTRGILRSLFLLEPLRREMRETLSLDPRYEPALHVLGEVYLELPQFVGGNLKKAVARFKEARALNPNDLVDLISLAKAYQQLGEKENALEVLNAALAVKTPADPGEAADNQKDIQKLLKEISGKN